MLWDDEHISKSMLEVHLNPKVDGASRSPEFIEESVQWITQLAAPVQGKKILDLGCGPGLYTQPLHLAGFTVTGMDYSRRSIQYAQLQATLNDYEITYHYQNYLTMDYTEEFDVITLIYCDFGVLSPQEQTTLLHKVYTALRPGGLFIFDVFTPARYINFKPESSTVKFSSGGFWSAVPHICVRRSYAYPHNTYLERYIILTETQQAQYHLWEHAFNSDELHALAKNVGFTVDLYGNATGAPVQENDEVLCAVYRKPEGKL